MRHVVLQCLLAFVLAMPGLAAAQATRTWVSGVGDDANPCSRTAPCRTFAGAISKTAAGGVINVLDPGAYGAVTITKSITIESDGDFAGVLVSGTNAIIVNAAAADVVTLRGMSLHGVATGLNGVRFVAGRALVLENLTIESFTQSGIEFVPTTAATLTLRNVLVRGVASSVGAFAGVLVAPGTGGSAAFTLDDVVITGAGRSGLRVGAGARGTMRGGQIQSSGTEGVFVTTPLAPAAPATASVILDGVHVIDSIGAGVLADGSGAAVRLSGVVVSGNAVGASATNSAVIASYGNNRVTGNVVDGTPLTPVPSQ
jgi:hypothetical protein